MTEITTAEMLHQYEELTAHRDLMASRMQQLIDAAITDEVRIAIEEIKIEFEPEIEEMDAAIKALGDELKFAVASTGQKVIGQRYQVIYTKPRVSWNAKALEGYAAAHPEITTFQKVGKPGAQIRVLRRR